MNDLEKYFAHNHGREIAKWTHYFEIYERHFARFRGTDVHVLEFGVSHGGSLQMWRHYFGPKCRVFGVDINPECKKLEEDGVEIFIGDQEDRSFLRTVGQKIPRIDIVIDDGGHTMKQQIRTYEELFPRVAPNGVYLCEDLHTSYWRRWGGGLRKRGTFIEYSKDFIDALNAWHSKRPRRFGVTDFTRSVHSLHYYSSVLVIEKRPMAKPTEHHTGTRTIQSWEPPKTLARRIKRLLGRSN
jgi:hypothetical protein